MHRLTFFSRNYLSLFTRFQEKHWIRAVDTASSKSFDKTILHFHQALCFGRYNFDIAVSYGSCSIRSYSITNEFD